MCACDRALEDLYVAFHAEKPRAIEACPCCLSDAEIQILLTKPLRELTSCETSAYADSVTLTVGDPTDFRYFLPRILEIQRDSGVFGWPSIEVIFGHLRRADWQSGQFEIPSARNRVWAATSGFNSAGY